MQVIHCVGNIHIGRGLLLARSWVGTGRVDGVGLDCANLSFPSFPPWGTVVAREPDNYPHPG